MKDGDLIIGIMASLGNRSYSIGQLIALADPFNVTSISVRTSISRMKKNEILEAAKIDGKKMYFFSKKGEAIISNVALSFTGPDWTEWNGTFWGLFYSFPGNDKKNRYRITKKLSLYRFAMLYPGFWIRPFNENEHLETKLDGIFNSKNCRVIKFHPVKQFTVKEAAVIWNIDHASACMKKATNEALRALSAAKSFSPKRAFVEKLVTGEHIVAALFKDPLIPKMFLPHDWPAENLRKIFLKFNSVLDNMSRRFRENILEGVQYEDN